MKISVKATELTKQYKNCLILGVFEKGNFTPTTKKVDEASKGFITQLIKQGAFTGKVGQLLPIYYLAHTSFEKILLVGLGNEDKFGPANFRKAVIAAVKALNTAKITSAVCYLSEAKVKDFPLTWNIKQIVEAAGDAEYRFDLFKSQKDEALTLKEFIIHNPEPKAQKACELALQQGQAIADGIVLTKNLANLPSNICTPTFLAEQAKDLAAAHKNISLKILEEKEMQKLGMGALLGVAQGSIEDAKLICLEYKGGIKNKAPVALVGKGVTFDTGGNSIKPADSMVGMKYDMCGAATVLGIMKAAAQLKLPINIVGIIPAVENMPGGTAYKPEDILTSMSGQTIEVISTDAEGRLILADALTYCERYNPEVVIDIATLTGAVIIALGFHAAGLVSNDDALAKDLLKAGEKSFDRAWQLPLWDEFQEQIKSPFADMSNSGGRSAGTITAGCFLERFAKKFRWAHLDVAGTAAMMMGTNERMATGRPVPMLMQYLIDKSAYH